MSSRAEVVKAFLADLARPFALYVTFGSAAIATVRLAWAGGDLNSAAIFVGAVLAGGGAIYGAKAAEETRKSGHTAEVEKARAQAAPPVEPAKPSTSEERSLEDPA